MEFLIGLVVLGILGFFVLSIAGGAVGLGLAVAEPGKREKAEEGKGETLRKLFGDDAPDVVTYGTQPFNALRPPVVIAGAVERGYQLVHDDNGTLTFQRQSSSSPSSK